MVFSSAIFLFFFLPLVFLLSRLPFGLRWQNLLLAFASLVFYAFGNLQYVPLFLASVLVNFLAGLLLGGRCRGSRAVLAASVVLNLGVLCVYKYTDFFLANLSLLPGVALRPTGLVMPIGISFFTFQGMSYVIDTYRDPARGSRSFLDVLLYISFFPQLIAGPIVRWGDIAEQIHSRVCTPEKTWAGIRRFVVGLSKKLLLADAVAAAVDAAFASGAGDWRLCWLGGVCFTLQIYFDFSGYSDMAIGMGKMFGFSIRENFLFPYTAGSIREFWRRWHVSLSTWFREYLYFPLGGSRKGRGRAALNRLIVFFCTGLWHGANWTFVLWGLGHGLLSSLEGSGVIPVERLQKSRLGRGVCRAYTLLAVCLLFTLFHADSVGQGFLMIGAMFAFRTAPGASVTLAKLLDPAFLVTLLAALLLAGKPGARAQAFLCGEAAGPDGAPGADATPERSRRPGTLPAALCCLLLLILSVLSLAQSGFHPFIYFQF